MQDSRNPKRPLPGHRSTLEDHRAPPRKSHGFLGWIALNCLCLNAIVYVTCEWIRRKSWLPNWLIDSNFYELGRFFEFKQGHDSWMPMLTAFHYWRTHPGNSIYEGVFFSQRIKFQYPLTSLLPLILLDKLGLSDAQISRVFGAIGWVSVAVVAALCVVIAIRSAAPLDSSTVRFDFATVAAIVLGSISFYPLLKGCVIGQIQTELTLAYTAAFYYRLRGKERISGVLIGLMILVKPQYVLLLVWALLRKRWSEALTGLASIAIVLPVAIILFGWHTNLDYLNVVRQLGRTGESFFQNHSMNGLLNRLLVNGGDQMFHQDSFPPFNAVVYLGTLVSSIMLIGLAFVFPVGRALRGGMADFACMTTVATIASPIAWQHHYGVLLPILVWLWFGRTSGRAPVRRLAWLVSAYILIADCFSPLNLSYHVPALNIIQSHIYFGGLIVVWLLLSPRYSAPSQSQIILDTPDFHLPIPQSFSHELESISACPVI